MANTPSQTFNDATGTDENAVARAASYKSVYVYEAPVRAWHWLNALSILVRAPGGPDEALASLCEAMRRLLARHPEWGPARALSLAGAEARCCDRLGDGEGLLRCRLRELELVRQLGDTAAAAAVETNLVFALQELGTSYS